jgi:hypothetical protein
MERRYDVREQKRFNRGSAAVQPTIPSNHMGRLAHWSLLILLSWAKIFRTSTSKPSALCGPLLIRPKNPPSRKAT